MNKNFLSFIVLVSSIILIFIYIVIRIEKSPNTLIVERMANTFFPVKQIILQVNEPESNYDALIFYLTKQNTMCCAYYKKTILGYKFINAICELSTSNIDPKKNYIISLLYKDTLKYIIVGVLNHNMNENIQSIYWGDKTATIIDRNGYQIWYMYLEDPDQRDKLKFD